MGRTNIVVATIFPCFVALISPMLASAVHNPAWQRRIHG